MLVALFALGCVEPAPDWEDVALPRDRGSAVRARQDLGRSLREEDFAVGPGAETPLVDVLFVLDNSWSMFSVFRGLHEGVAEVLAQGAFPERTRIAVTSTLPADPADLTLPHPAVRGPAIAEVDPGFQRLVDQSHRSFP